MDPNIRPTTLRQAPKNIKKSPRAKNPLITTNITAKPRAKPRTERQNFVCKTIE